MSCLRRSRRLRRESQWPNGLHYAVARSTIALLVAHTPQSIMGGQGNRIINSACVHSAQSGTQKARLSRISDDLESFRILDSRFRWKDRSNRIKMRLPCMGGSLAPVEQLNRFGDAGHASGDAQHPQSAWTLLSTLIASNLRSTSTTPHDELRAFGPLASGSPSQPAATR